MKITKIDLIPIRIAFKQTYKIPHGDYPVDKLIIKVLTDEGIIGIGESLTATYYGETLGTVVSATKVLSKVLIGEDPFRLAHILEKMDRALFKNNHAKAAIDVALHDIIGKKLGAPVNVLLGGCCRDRIPMGCDVGIGEDPVVVAQKWVPEGASLMKLKLGNGPDNDLNNLRKLHEAFPELPVIADANESYGVQHLSFFRKMQAYDNLKAIEQPCPRSNFELMSTLMKALDVPIMADEPIGGLNEAFDVITRHAADVIKIAWRRVGGLYREKQTLALAKSAGIPVYSECPILTGVGTAASLHASSSIPDEDLMCIGGFSGVLRLEHDILKEPLRREKGEWQVPRKPGLGVELDEEILSKVRIEMQEV